MERELIHKIFSGGLYPFESAAFDILNFQYSHNLVYRRFADALGKSPQQVSSIKEIPFLPVGFFKSHEIKTTDFTEEVLFESSGTTGTSASRHFVKDKSLYQTSFLSGFKAFYSEPEEWCILGLLPSYLERSNSSLVMMVNDLINLSGNGNSGFYLHDHAGLYHLLRHLEAQQQKTILIGVTFALLDFAEKYPIDLRHTLVVETGGMKGRREEITRQEVHDLLKARFNTPVIHAEYGMTELLSQAWSGENGLFRCPPWMRILVREEDDPLFVRSAEDAHSAEGVNGLINVIDLANIYSCSFIATDDVGKVYQDGSFNVLGRMDNSDIRGCSLMVV